MANVKKKNVKNQIEKKSSNILTMKILVFLGVMIFSFILIYLSYHFFVEKSDIKINMSTDKQIEYFKINGEEELILTQKYVSDLTYSMRYDVNTFKVLKYKSQDIFKHLDDERILVMVEKSTLPTNCSGSSTGIEYNNCYMKIDDFTENYYVALSDKIYKITIKTPGNGQYDEGTAVRIAEMLNSFVINK